jgi:hypothetical protein
VFEVPSVISSTRRRPAFEVPWNTPSVFGSGGGRTAGPAVAVVFHSPPSTPVDP